MDNLKMKNMIILRDLPSNIMEEIIVVLKDVNNVNNAKTIEFRQKSAESEAKNIIEEISKNVRNKESNKMKSFQKKYNRLKLVSLVMGIYIFLIIILKILN